MYVNDNSLKYPINAEIKLKKFLELFILKKDISICSSVACVSIKGKKTNIKRKIINKR